MDMNQETKSLSDDRLRQEEAETLCRWLLPAPGLSLCRCLEQGAVARVYLV